MTHNPATLPEWAALETLAAGYAYAPADEGIYRHECLTLDMRYAGLTPPIIRALMALARAQKLEEWRDRMMDGEPVNITENRAVHHTALRAGTHADVKAVLAAMKEYTESFHADGRWTDVVHIGIGGSDLGPRLVVDALSHLPAKVRVHFVSNVDAAHIQRMLAPLDPDTTLFIVASKTFTTQETMMNAAYARAWLAGRPVREHMIALSTNEAAVREFGIDPANMFPFWDWVGGRFSVWSAIGMPIALAYGFDVFESFLAGAKTMDDHFQTEPLENNIPVLIAMNGIWNRNFMRRGAYAVLPYAQNLRFWPDYLQQLDMESNGKSVDRAGRAIADYATGPAVFGQAGTNGQHAFHQWLHQGTDVIHSEFVTIDASPYDPAHAKVLNAHAKAQAQALALGRRNADEPHRNYAGGRPSLTITLKDMEPRSIGALLALYEHKIAVQGIVWNINSFDQWGVELGKDLAKLILATP